MSISAKRLSKAPDRTIAAYERLAHEYDSAAHATTRSLEMASARALRQALRLVESGKIRKVVEVGCGTGATTRELISALPGVPLICSDPSPAMLEVARGRLGSRATVEWHLGTASEVLAPGSLEPGDLVVGGLADPFLTSPFALGLGAAMASGGWSIWTVPTSAWAARERLERLRLSRIDCTRFVLADRTVVVADSFAYGADELRTTFERAGFAVTGGVERGHPPASSRLSTEVAWVLATRPASGRRS